MQARADARLCDLLPAGYIPLGFVVSIKALDRDGDVCLISARTQEVTAWEALGMLDSTTDDLRTWMRQHVDTDDD